MNPGRVYNEMMQADELMKAVSAGEVNQERAGKKAFFINSEEKGPK